MCKKCFILFGGGKNSEVSSYEVSSYDFLIFFRNTIDYMHGGMKKNRMVFCKIILY